MTDVTSFDGTRLALETAGPGGAPTVVLVHGLGSATCCPHCPTPSWSPCPARATCCRSPTTPRSPNR